MSKHTPGPWRAEISCDETGAPQKCWWISAKGDVDIGETSGEKRSDEEAANARLIAAAPELYEACKEYEKWEAALILDDEVWAEGAMPRLTEELYDWMLRLQDMRIAAIEKAKGVPD